MRLTRSVRRVLALVVAVCGCVTLATLGPAAPPAQAQSLRYQIPIVAGTALELPGARQCTVGAVLKSRSWSSLATPFRKATRYAVIAKHCADVGREIRVIREVVGTVTWASPTYDVALATIPPSTVQRPICAGASQLHHCTIPAATPRAVGRIIITNFSQPAAVPISGIGSPSPDQHFCTSGSVSFVNCGFLPAGVPPEGWGTGELAARTTNGRNVVMGDSGGPVMSVGGTLYGIIVMGGFPVYPDMMGYLPIETIFRDLGYEYQVAPA